VAQVDHQDWATEFLFESENLQGRLIVNPSVKRLALVAAPSVVVLAVLYFVFRGDDADLALNQPDARKKSAGANVEADPEYIIVGGVRRKASDVKPITHADHSGEHPIAFDPGVNPPLDPDANPQVRSVIEALKTGEHPERLSAMLMPNPFDPAAFTADPQAYLNIAEPGRVFQTAQPGPGVRVLLRASPAYSRVKQGESTKLRVLAQPKAPVTFTSFDLGKFGNGLVTHTVQANEKGLAEVEFFGTPGTYSDVNILAGSPILTEQVKFVVFVEVPGMFANNQGPQASATAQ
jgi:hypothetical protein